MKTETKTLEQMIESAAENLPEDWEVRIDVQRGYGEVIVTRPDGSEVPMQDGESTIAQQFKNASLLIRDEIQADAAMPNGPKLSYVTRQKGNE